MEPQTKIEAKGDVWHVYTSNGTSWWGVGVDFPTEAAARLVADTIAGAADDSLRAEIRDALEGDSNDAEHDALAAVASALGVEWTSPYSDDFEPSPDPNWMNP